MTLSVASSLRFITAQVAVRYSVIPERAREAIYKLLQQEMEVVLRSFLWPGDFAIRSLFATCFGIVSPAKEV